MVVRNYSVWMIGVLAWTTLGVKAQQQMNPALNAAFSLDTFTQNNLQQIQDSIPVLQLNEGDLAKIPSIRSQFEKQNNSYSRALPPSKNVLRFLQKDKLEMSEEARYWLNLIRNSPESYDENVALGDTVIVNPLFMPLVLHGDVVPDDFLTDFKVYPTEQTAFTDRTKTDSLFKSEAQRLQLKKEAYTFVRRNHPEYFRYSQREMPTETIKATEIKKETYENLPLTIQSNVTEFNDIDSPTKFIPDRLYWQSGFESVIQFSQNYVSPNWYKGGSSTLNLFTRNYLRYDYKRDKVQLTNEMELKISTYTAPKDTLRNYKMGDDLFRVHSNLGYQAFSTWYYTFDAEFKTQLFNNYKENTNNLQTALLSPYSINMGLGMKFNIDKKYADKNKYVKLTTNIAPLAYTYMYSINDNIDLSRHGFKKKPDSDQYEHVLSQFGSTVRANLEIKFNRNVNWQSRLYYFTSYDRVEAEFENTLTMAISRFFSTRIYLNLRYDDGVTKSDEFDSYYQINELLSFGFNYKW